MANWVECKAHGSVKPIWVNLDQVVHIASASGGSALTYAGTDATFVVANRPEDILAHEKVRAIA